MTRQHDPGLNTVTGEAVALQSVAVEAVFSKVFACRHCYHLAYESQREDVADRVARKADTIRRRLGWKPGILNHNGWKPKGMHWQTFEKLRTQHDAMVSVALEGIARKLRLFER